MDHQEYRNYDAVGLGELVNKGEVSAGEVLEVAIARARAVNPTINAIVHAQYDRAKAEIDAGLPDGPLKGVPYLIKDLGVLQKGEPATLGSKLFADYVADHDSLPPFKLTKNSSRPLCAQMGWTPPSVEICHFPSSTFGNGRTKISGRPASFEW